jgi:hypothetical protein
MGSRNLDDLPQNAAGEVRDFRQVRLHFVHLSVWAATKIAFLTGVVVGLLTILALMIVWLILIQSGTLDETVGTFLSGTSTSGTASVKSTLSFGPALTFAIIAGILNTVALTALGTVGTLLYNFVVRVTGGILLGFTTW